MNSEAIEQLAARMKDRAMTCPRGGLTKEGMTIASVCSDLDKFADELRAIAALEAGRSSDWVLVPREPTEAMWDAAVKASCEAEEIYSDERGPDVWEKFGLRKNRILHQFAAMLAAAPQQPTGRSGEAEALEAARADLRAAAATLRETLDRLWPLETTPQQPPPVGVTDATALLKDARRVLDMTRTNSEVRAGKPRKAWNGAFVESETDRVIGAIDAALSPQQPAPSVSDDEQESWSCRCGNTNHVNEPCGLCGARAPAAAPVSEPAAHPDALPDGTFSKSTMKRHAALRGDATSGKGRAALLATALEQSQQQCDEDGTMIAVSRQAVVETIELLRRLTTTGQSITDEIAEKVLTTFHDYTPHPDTWPPERHLELRVAAMKRALTESLPATTGQGDVEAVDRAVRSGRRFYFQHNPANTLLAQVFNDILIANGTHEADLEAHQRREVAARLAPFGQQQEGQG